MECSNCKNRRYCLAFVEEPDMYGCTSGVPPFEPGYVARGIVGRIRTGSERLGLNEAEYKNRIFDEVEVLLHRAPERVVQKGV